MHVVVSYAFTLVFILMILFTTWRNMLVTFDDVTGSWLLLRKRVEQRADTTLNSPYGQSMSDTSTVSLKFSNDGKVVLGEFDKWDAIFEIEGTSGPQINYLEYTASPTPTAGKWTVSGIYMDADASTAEVTDPGLLNPTEEIVIFANPSASARANTYNRAILVAPNGVSAKVIYQSLAIVYVLDESDRIIYRYDTDGNYMGFNSIDSANTDAKGLTNKGDNFWTTDIVDDDVYKYTTAFSLDSSWGQSILNANGVGITTDGANIWIVDSTGLKVFKYDMSGTPDVGLPTFALNINNTNPSGVTTDGTHLWIVDEADDVVYKYTTAGSSVSNFALTADNADPTGITTDGAFFWVTDVADGKVYSYRLDGTYLSSFGLFAANADPQGVTVRSR